MGNIMTTTFIGQSQIIREMDAIKHSLITKRTSGVNILLRGFGGCGKTFLAKLFCYSLVGSAYTIQIAENGKFRWSEERSKLKCHIIDEVHTIKTFESLYTVMDAKQHILVFCTTDSGVLSEPFLSRCIVLTFQPYSIEDLTLVAEMHSQSEGLGIPHTVAKLIASRSRGNPRIAKSYLDRVFFLIERGYHSKTLRGVESALEDIGIFNGGYTDLDYTYLKFLKKVGVASLTTISAAIKTDKATVMRYVEPFLLDKGHIIITSKGRKFQQW